MECIPRRHGNVRGGEMADSWTIDDANRQSQVEESLRHHQEAVATAENLFLVCIIGAKEKYGWTFQEVADALSISKHWAWKLYRRGKDQGL